MTIFNNDAVPKVALDLKGGDEQELMKVILAKGYPIMKRADAWYCVMESNVATVQGIIDAHQAALPDLSPRQFKYLLAVTELDVAIDAVLAQLRTVNLQLYAECKSQLEGGLVFFFVKSLALYTELKPFLVQLNSQLEFSEDDLRSFWMQAHNNKGV